MYRSSDTYEDIVKVIIEIYLDYDIKDFPIDEKVVCRRLGVALVPYSECPEEARALLEKKSKHGFFVRGTKKNPPTIYYNAIVTAIGGKYFRVGEVRPDGRIGRYLTLDLKDPSIPGTFQGAARRAENFRLTHFRMTYKKGTV